MNKKAKKENVSDDYLKTLEEVKKQYQQYVEVSELYKLPMQKDAEPLQHQPPSIDPQHRSSSDDRYNSHQVKRSIHGFME